MQPVKDLPDNKRAGSVTLYDGGGWYLAVIFLSIPAFLGSLIDYGWNFLVLHLALKRLSLAFKASKKLIYTLLITIIGFVIDWVYYSIFWKENWGEWWPCEPLFPARDPNPYLVLISILVPMLLIALSNYVLTRLYLKLEMRQAVIVGAAMGVFTAPWIIIIIQLATSY